MNLDCQNHRRCECDYCEPSAVVIARGEIRGETPRAYLGAVRRLRDVYARLFPRIRTVHTSLASGVVKP